MPARFQFPSSFAKLLRKPHSTAGRTKKPVWIFGLIVLAGLAIWVNTARAATSSPTVTSALTPALKLAVGTVNLEGTDQAVDSASAVKLLPLWQLIEQLDTSGSAAPEEITAVINEIQLSMTAEQIKAIDAMSIDQSQLAAGSPAPSTTASTSANGTGAQAAAAAADPSLGGMPGGDVPMDAGGGPMPSGSSQASTSASKTSSATAAPMAIKQVIQLLQTKVQS